MLLQNFLPIICLLTPLHSQDIPEELSEQIPSSSQHDIPTELSGAPGTSPISEDPVTPVTASPISEDPVTPVTASPISEDPVTPVTEEVREEPVTPDVRRGVAVDDTPGRDADVETEFETSPEKGKSCEVVCFYFSLSRS